MPQCVRVDHHSYQLYNMMYNAEPHTKFLFPARRPAHVILYDMLMGAVLVCAHIKIASTRVMLNFILYKNVGYVSSLSQFMLSDQRLIRFIHANICAHRSRLTDNFWILCCCFDIVYTPILNSADSGRRALPLLPFYLCVDELKFYDIYK